MFYLYYKRYSGKPYLKVLLPIICKITVFTILVPRVFFSDWSVVAYCSLLSIIYLWSSPDMYWIIGYNLARVSCHNSTIGVPLRLDAYARFYFWRHIYFCAQTVYFESIPGIPLLREVFLHNSEVMPGLLRSIKYVYLMFIFSLITLPKCLLVSYIFWL